MSRDTKFLLVAILCILAPILSLIYLSLNSKILIPAGYDLAIDGYVISRTLIIIFLFHLISKFGYFLYKEKK